MKEIHSDPPSTEVPDATKPTGDLLRAGATVQEVYDDTLRTAFDRDAIVNIGDIQNITEKGPVITNIPRTPPNKTNP